MDRFLVETWATIILNITRQENAESFEPLSDIFSRHHSHTRSRRAGESTRVAFLLVRNSNPHRCKTPRTAAA